MPLGPRFVMDIPHCVIRKLSGIMCTKIPSVTCCDIVLVRRGNLCRDPKCSFAWDQPFSEELLISWLSMDTGRKASKNGLWISTSVSQLVTNIL